MSAQPQPGKGLFLGVRIHRPSLGPDCLHSASRSGQLLNPQRLTLCSLYCVQKKLKGPETRQDQPDWSSAADNGANEGGGKRGHRPAKDTEDAGRMVFSRSAALGVRF